MFITSFCSVVAAGGHVDAGVVHAEETRAQRVVLGIQAGDAERAVLLAVDGDAHLLGVVERGHRGATDRLAGLVDHDALERDGRDVGGLVGGPGHHRESAQRDRLRSHLF